MGNPEMTERPLSENARSLAEHLDAEHVAAVLIPTARLAAEEGMSYRQWDAWRRGELLSVGAAIEELRAAGWELDVKEQTAPTENCERAILVEALHVGRAP